MTHFERVDITDDYRRVVVSQYAANPDAIETAPGFHTRYVSAGDPDVSLRKMSGGGWRRGRLHSRRDHVVVWLRSGHGTVRSEIGEVLEVDAGGPAVLAAGVEYDYDVDTDHATLLHVSDELVRAALPGGAEADRVLLGQWTPQPGGDPLHRVVHDLGPRILDPALDDRDRAAADWTLAQALVRTLPEAHEDEARSAAVRSALAFIRAHAAEPITLADIAAAALCSERSLQDRFARDLGTTPTALLRATRMRRVREVLRAAEPGEVSIGEVARANSIGHLGRFAGEYRKQFGEPPSATLRRAPGAYVA
jgi:AraC-like DNA-binding protein